MIFLKIWVFQNFFHCFFFSSIYKTIINSVTEIWSKKIQNVEFFCARLLKIANTFHKTNYNKVIFFLWNYPTINLVFLRTTKNRKHSIQKTLNRNFKLKCNAKLDLFQISRLWNFYLLHWSYLIWKNFFRYIHSLLDNTLKLHCKWYNFSLIVSLMSKNN